MGRGHVVATIVLCGVALSACGNAVDAPDATEGPSNTDTPQAVTTADMSQPAGKTAPALSERQPGIPAPLDGAAVDPEGEPIDFLTYGAGAFPIRFDRATQGQAAAAVLDGRTGYAGLTRSPTGPEQPISITIELPAETTFQAFGIPPQSRFGCCVGAHIDTVTVEGTASSPDDGYQQLARFRINPEVHNDKQLFPAVHSLPVRWVRVTLEGRQVPDPEDYRGTSFTDLFGYGVQAPIRLPDNHFSGRWLTGGGGNGPRSNRIELIQDGALVTGCGMSGGAHFTVAGGVENGLLKYVAGRDTVPVVAVINSEGQLSGALIGRSFGRIIGEPGGDPTSCTPGEAPPPNPVVTALDECRPAIVYGINFDVNAVAIRPDAEPALNQIRLALAERSEMSVTIEGHTDSDASDDYNLDLSRRRAEAVVNWLVEKGANAGKIAAVGKGEAEPIADNETSAGKASNRRVEVEPSCS